MDKEKLIDINFEGVRFFKPSEFSAPHMLDRTALLMLDGMRYEEGKRRDIIITINADYATTGHADNSMHRFGKAFDIVIRNGKTKEPLPIEEQFLIALRSYFSGIGYYPYWKSPGLHVDNRPMTIYGRRALWMRNENGIYEAPTIRLG